MPNNLTLVNIGFQSERIKLKTQGHFDKLITPQQINYVLKYLQFNYHVYSTYMLLHIYKEKCYNFDV